jgi:DNA ligase-4
MIRILLKNDSLVYISEISAILQFHFFLFNLLSFQNSLGAAVKLLDKLIIPCILYRIAKGAESLLKEIANSEFRFQIGVMVARPAYEKARNIKYYYQLTGLIRMNVEWKYDNEYC